MKKCMSLLLAVLLALLPVTVMADFFDQMRNWWNDLTSVAQDLAGQATELFSTGVELVGDAAKDFIGKAEEYLTQLYPDWRQETRNAWQVLSEAAEDAGSHAKEEVAAAWEEIKGWMAEAGDSVSEETQTILNAIGGAAGVVEAKIALWTDMVQTYFNDSMASASPAVQEAWATLKEAAANAGSVAADKLKEAYNTVLDWLNSQKGEEAERAREALNSLVEELTPAE
ncbi:MAG: hypothetical protein IKP40_07635 [Clostridia bacterium]|nr:hypothetical protein [Clostridia bacterium]